jgi:hypothetical protein
MAVTRIGGPNAVDQRLDMLRKGALFRCRPPKTAAISVNPNTVEAFSLERAENRYLGEHRLPAPIEHGFAPYESSMSGPAQFSNWTLHFATLIGPVSRSN